MQAKSNAPYPVTAFTGHEFVRYEWRPVPAGYEDAALRHPLLDVRELPEPDPGQAEVDATGAAIELAEEHGIDLAAVEGSGHDGRILVGDVEPLIEEE